MAAITAEQKQRILEIAAGVLSREDMVVTKEGGDRLVQVLGEKLEELVLRITGEYFVLLTDAEATEWLVRFGGKTKISAKVLVRAWRKEARIRGVGDNVKIHAVVRAGVRLKTDVPYMEHCHEEFRYIGDWGFADDGTNHALVSWIPSPLVESSFKSVHDQRSDIIHVKTIRLFPMSYEFGFGSAVHVAGMVLAHFRATGEKFPGCVRTETVAYNGRSGNGNEKSRRLILSWLDNNIYLDAPPLDDGRQGGLSVFAVGVVNAV